MSKMKRSRFASISSESSPTASTAKVAAVDYSSQPTATPIRCDLPTHSPLDFADSLAYERHYLSQHSHRCIECHSNFPTARFLELHIAEEHDPIAAVRREAGEKTYACFIEDCEKVCMDWKKRRSHLVDKHYFPRNYDFLIVRNGIDGRRSLLRPGVDAQGHRRSSRERAVGLQSWSDRARSTSPAVSEHIAQEQQQASEAVLQEQLQDAPSIEADIFPTDILLDQLTSGFSALRMVPRAVQFGRRKGRAGLAQQ